MFVTTMALLAGINCAPQIRAELSEWKTSNNWIREAPLEDNSEFYRSKSEIPNTWIYLSINKSEKRAKIFKKNSLETKRAEFSNQDCSPQLLVEQAKKPLRANGVKAFDDEALNKAVANGEGVIYVWSPHMPLSIEGKEEARKAAESLGLKYLQVEEEELASPDLMARGVTRHYPSIVMFSNSRVSPIAYLGKKTVEQYQRYMSRELKTLKAGQK